MGIFNQAICTIAASYLCLSMGLIFAWPSGTLKLFESTNTTLHRPMQETELALLGSLSSIGALVSTPIMGFLLDVVGRKKCMMGSALMQVVAWALISSGSRVELILTAVFMSGVGGVGFLVAPVFISEICQESIRGAMVASTMIFYAIGMLLSYVFSGCFTYNIMIYICLSLSILGAAMVVICKESPMYLMKRGLDEEAAKSFAFYRNAKVDSKIVQQEMSVLRRAFNPEMDEDTPEEEKLKPELNEFAPKEKLSMWKFIKKSKATRKAIVITLVLMTASLFQGLVVVQVYAEPLFEEAVPNMSATVCSIILAIVTIVFGLVAAYLTDVLGRRPLLFYASILAGLCCIALGTQLQYHWAPHWVTALFIYLFTIFFTFGAGTVPYVVGPEVFLPEVKSVMSMVVIEWAWLCNFIILFIFNPLVAAIGLGPVFHLFAIMCLLTAIYTYFYLPETKGLTLDQIQILFSEKKQKNNRS